MLRLIESIRQSFFIHCIDDTSSTKKIINNRNRTDSEIIKLLKFRISSLSMNDVIELLTDLDDKTLSTSIIRQLKNNSITKFDVYNILVPESINNTNNSNTLICNACMNDVDDDDEVCKYCDNVLIHFNEDDYGFNKENVRTKSLKIHKFIRIITCQDKHHNRIINNYKDSLKKCVGTTIPSKLCNIYNATEFFNKVKINKSLLTKFRYSKQQTTFRILYSYFYQYWNIDVPTLTYNEEEAVLYICNSITDSLISTNPKKFGNLKLVPELLYFIAVNNVPNKTYPFCYLYYTDECRVQYKQIKDILMKMTNIRVPSLSSISPEATHVLFDE